MDRRGTTHEDQSGQQNDSDHYGHLGFIENPRAGTHCRDDQADFAPGDHSAADSETANSPHSHAQCRHSASEQFANHSDGEDGDQQEPVPRERAEISG